MNEFLWYIPNQVERRPPGRRRGRGPQQPGPAHGAGEAGRGPRLGRRAARHRLGAARHLHGRHGPRGAHHDLPAAGGDPPGLLASGQLRLGGQHPRRALGWPPAGQHRLGSGQPCGVRRQRGRPGAALRPHGGVHAARAPAVDRGGGHLPRRALLRHRLDRGHAAGRARRSEAPAALLRWRVRGRPAGRGRRGRRAALLGRAARRCGRADRASQGPHADGRAAARAARVRAADHHAGPRHHRPGLGRRRGEGRQDGGRGGRAGLGAAPYGRRASSACSTSPSAATCSTTASTPRRDVRRRRRRHDLAGRLRGGRREGAAEVPGPRRSPTSSSRTRRTATRSCGSATSCCR